MAELGISSIGGVTSSLNQNYLFAYGPFELTQTSKLNSISWYTSSTVVLKLGVYLDNAGLPDKLISSVDVPSGTGWRTGTLAGELEKNKSYWIGMISGNSTSSRYVNGSKKLLYVSRNYSLGLSDPYPSGPVITSNVDYSAYISYTPVPFLPFIPDKSSYVYNINRDVVEVELDGGLARRRRDIAGSASRIECTWFLLPGEYQYFMAFYRSQLKRGAIPFLIELLLEQPYLEEIKASFRANTLSVKQIGLSYEVSAELEAVPNTDNDYDEMVLDFYIGGEQTNPFWGSLEKLVNVDLEEQQITI